LDIEVSSGTAEQEAGEYEAEEDAEREAVDEHEEKIA
jgi:hypothetical protein